MKKQVVVGYPGDNPGQEGTVAQNVQARVGSRGTPRPGRGEQLDPSETHGKGKVLRAIAGTGVGAPAQKQGRGGVLRLSRNKQQHEEKEFTGH